MKVYWQYRPNDTGKGHFTEQLIPALEDQGVQVRLEPEGCDATVSYTYFRDRGCKLPGLLRVDGLHMVKDRVQDGRTAVLAQAIKQAKGVVWQSDFSRHMLSPVTGVGRKNFTIWNGDSPERFADVQPIISPWPRNILMAAKWHDGPDEPRLWKRLKDHDAIAHEYVHTDPQACVWILGDCGKDYPSSPQVRYVGWVDHQTLARYMKMADIFMYAAWLDWCPNVVVEAMAAGCYIICGPNGGHAEIAAGYGTVLRDNPPAMPQDIHKGHIPRCDTGMWADAIDEYYFRMPNAKVNPEIRIERVAEKYKAALEGILQ
jgi:glycosyltransferase involved in cell wall biosynthesis